MRTIWRTAHMLFGIGQEYDPSVLLEAKEKGYNHLGFEFGDWYCDTDLIELLRRTAKDAQDSGLQISVLTCYQRNCDKALTEHAEWRMVFNDGSIGTEACPFNEEYKALYIETMRKVAQVPGVQEIQLNDEAHLTDWGERWGCYCKRCTRLFVSESGQEPPRDLDWDDELWRHWIKWRFVNWVRVHQEIRDAIKQTSPAVLLSVQLTPFAGLHWNPWFSGVDIAALADVMDVLYIDPYHTYHSHDFRPDIVYLTESAKYVRGALAGKPLGVWTQGMTWPEFSRALTEADGRWTAALPIAIGAESVTPCAYPLLQERQDVAHGYEDSFRWDRYYRETEPAQHVALIQGWQTKVWLLSAVKQGRAGYDLDYFRPACRILRRAHVLYECLWDRRLASENLSGFKALLLPRVSCLSREQGEALRGFAGGVVATSDTGCYDQEGKPAEQQALGKRVRVKGWREFGGLSIKDPSHPIFADIQEEHLPFTIRATQAEAGVGVTVLATFLDSSGHDTGLPAILASDGQQRFVYLGFEPWHARSLSGLRQELPEMCASLLADSVRWVSGGEPAVSIEEPAPKGMEYFWSTGTDLYVVTLGNYYLDDSTVTFRVAPPADRHLALAYDAEARRGCEVKEVEGAYRVQVPLDAKGVKVVAIRFQS